MSLSTTVNNKSYADIGVGVASARIEPDQWLVTAAIDLLAGQILEYSFAQAHIIEAITLAGANAGQPVAPNSDGQCVFPSAPAEVNAGRGLLWFGLYPAFDFTLSPAQQTLSEPAIVIPVQAQVIVPQTASRTLATLEISASGRYFWVVYNNTSNYRLSTIITAQARVSTQG